jgi:Tol biopolymer transport system component
MLKREKSMCYIKYTKKIELLLLCMLILLTTTSCTSKSSNFGMIYTNNYMDIYRIQNDMQGSNDQLTFTPTIGEYQILVSSNGEKIVFEAGFTDLEIDSSEMQEHIYLLDATTKEMIDITNVLVEYVQVWDTFSMDWLSDHKQFVVVNCEGQEYDYNCYVELINFDGKNKERIPIPTIGDIPALIQSVDWSPDGKMFLLTQGVIGTDQQNKHPGSAISVYDLETEKITQLTKYEDQCLPREWSPTSQQIVITCSVIGSYSSEGAAQPEVVRILDVEKNNQPYEHIGFISCNNPSWSPDGKQISFVCENKKGQEGIFIVNADGSEFHEIDIENIHNFNIYQGPHWSPDGTKIIYVAFLSESDVSHSNIYSVNIDGSDNHAITREEGAYIIEAVYSIN